MRDTSHLEQLKENMRYIGKCEREESRIYKLIGEKKKLKEKITNLETQLEDYKDKYDVLLKKQDKMEEILDSLGAQDNFDDFIKFITFLYENKEDFFNYIKYKKEFHDFLNNKNNDKEIKIESINIKESNEYKDLEKINEKNNIRISELEEKLSKLDSNIEDNDLFKQIKMQNNILLQNNKTLNAENEDFKKRLDILENNNINISDIKEDSIDINLKINEALERQKKSLSQEYENKYSKNVLSLSESIKTLEQTIKDLNERNDKLQEELQKIKSNKIKKDKKLTDNKSNNKDKLYNSIFIFDKLNEDWQKYISCFTYKDILKMLKLDMFINNDKKINKEDYKEVYEWLNIYELDEKKIKSNYNIKRKIKRCKIIYNKHHDDLKYIKFNINMLSYMKNNEFNDFLDILDDKIKQRKLPNNDLEDISDNILDINTEIIENIKDSKTNTKKCGNYGHGCNSYVINRTYCQECMDDGYFTTDNESD